MIKRIVKKRFLLLTNRNNFERIRINTETKDFINNLFTTLAINVNITMYFNNFFTIFESIGEKSFWYPYLNSIDLSETMLNWDFDDI